MSGFIINISEECNLYCQKITKSNRDALFVDMVLFKETIRTLIALDLEKTIEHIDLSNLMYALHGQATNKMLNREEYNVDKLAEDIFFRLSARGLILPMGKVFSAVCDSKLVQSYKKGI